MGHKHRFYIADFSASTEYTITDKDIIHKCSKVLRLKTGSFVYFFNGKDACDYQYELSKVEKKLIVSNFISKVEKNHKSLSICLYQALPNKLSKLEYIVQKCSEIGVQKIHFYSGRYSQDTSFLNDNKKERLKKISIESSEQSNRNYLPELIFDKQLDFSTITSGTNICFHTDSELGKVISEVDIDDKTVNLLVGPEGGFHPSEIDQLKQNGTQFVSLGNNVLRTETVGVVTSFYFIQTFS